MSRRDAEKQLLDMSVQAIEAAAGNAGKAKLHLSKMIRGKRDLELERVLYAPYHDAAVDGAILAGYKDPRAAGKYSSPRGTKPADSTPAGQPKYTSGFRDGTPGGRGGFDSTSTFPMAAAGDDETHDYVTSDYSIRFDGRSHVRLDLGLQTVEPGPEPKPWRPHLDAESLRVEMKVMVSLAMDIFLVNGKPARFCTGRELREFADNRNNQARFAAILANGLSDEQVAGEHWSDEEANAFYEEVGFKLPRK